MDKKNKNAMIVSIIALTLVIIGVTYAYFSARITGLESASTISLTAGRMGITYAEGDENVSVSNIYPREQEWLTKTITLTGYNTTDQDMEYDLGLNITNNTFIRGELTYSLTGVGSNGQKIADITGKPITKTSGFLKFGTGSFSQANGDTHVYTLKLWFKDNGQDQNYNQEAVFNAKVHVREQGSTVAKSNHNHDGKHCYTNDYVEGVTPTDGTEYSLTNGQYTYKYNYYWGGSSWTLNTAQAGWGVKVTNFNSTDPLTEELCAYINEEPLTNMHSMFRSSKATSIDLSSFDTSNVIDMALAFHSIKPSSIDLSTLDTSKVTNMDYLFGSSSLTSVDLSSFDTSNVTSMRHMFGGMTLTSLDLSPLDTSNVTDMEAMFAMSTITNLDVSPLDTSNVMTMETMFMSFIGNIIGLNTLDTSTVTDMYGMFQSCRSTSIDVTSFITSNVTNMGYMFYNTRATSLDLSSFDTSNVTDMGSMFEGSDVTILDLSTFDTSSVTDMFYMLDGAAATTGYARTQADADRFNNVAGSLSNGNNPDNHKPAGLTFVVK